jgi:hypothetical protein
MGWVVVRPLFGLLYQPQMIDDDCGEVGGMRTGRGNLSTQWKPAPVSLCPPQMPYDLTWARTRAAAVGSLRLTAWAIARPVRRVTARTNLRGTCCWFEGYSTTLYHLQSVTQCHRAGWCGDTFHLYQRGFRFESRPGNWLSSLTFFVDILSP